MPLISSLMAGHGWLRRMVPYVLVMVGAGISWWGLAPRIDQQRNRADYSEKQLIEARSVIAQQTSMLSDQQKVLDRLAGLERRLQQLDQVVARNVSAQAYAFEELRRHDQAIANYLAAPVPAALGRLYERPETTDPGAYRAPNGVQPGALQAAGSPSDPGQ